MSVLNRLGAVLQVNRTNNQSIKEEDVNFLLLEIND